MAKVDDKTDSCLNDSIEKYSDFKPSLWFRSGHVQIVLPTLFRKIGGVCYKRKRIQTPDDDFLDLDWSCAKEQL